MIFANVSFQLRAEYAGELKDFFPDKKVTIVHNSSMLLNPTYSDKGRRQIERDLRVRGVDIIFDDRVDDVDTSGNTSGTVKTRAGKVIEGDLIVRVESLCRLDDELTCAW